LSAGFSTLCEKTFSFSFIENSFSCQKNSTKKNLFLCHFDEVQQGRELAFFALVFIHCCAQLWLHFSVSAKYLADSLKRKAPLDSAFEFVASE
jgi:hypothetical protein